MSVLLISLGRGGRIGAFLNCFVHLTTDDDGDDDDDDDDDADDD